MKRINNLSEIDLANVTLAELRYGTGTHQSLGKGIPSRFGVITDLGDILENVWYEATERIALRDYESWLVDALEEWVKSLPYISDRREARKQALQMYSMRIFEAKTWVDYIPFNRKYRPDAIASEQFLTVKSECCSQPGEMTAEAINAVYTYCPICGRASKVTEYAKEQHKMKHYPTFLALLRSGTEFECDLIIGGVDMPATFVWNGTCTITDYGSETYAPIVNAAYKMLSNGNIEILCDDDKLGKHFVLAAAGYIDSKEWDRLFGTDQ